MRKLLIIIGLLSLVGSYFAHDVWTENTKRNTLHNTATATGAVVGAGVGAGVGAVIGGIGIAMCGTGIGIPAGAVMLGLAGLVGAGGAAVGSSVTDPGPKEMFLGVIDPAIWSVLFWFGIICFIIRFFLCIKDKINRRNSIKAQPVEIEQK
jgi:hypothetical protein